jgi:hypothetical protein
LIIYSRQTACFCEWNFCCRNPTVTDFRNLGSNNNTDSVCVTWHWGAFVQPLLEWKNNKYYSVKWSVSECCSVVMVWVIRCHSLLEDLRTIWICCLCVFYEYYYHNTFIPVYVVLFLFYNVIYAFLLYDGMFMYDYTNWSFSVLFPQL